MKRSEEPSILLTDQAFRKKLSEWVRLSDTEKNDVYINYELTVKEVETLRQLNLGLDFHRYEQPQSIIESAFEETIWKLAERKNEIKTKNATRKLYEQFAKIAAILIVPILLYTSFLQFFKANPVSSELQPQWVTVISQPGTITKLELPDGSIVCLNSESTISYPTIFTGDKREVSLKGEAFFEVVKNKKMPMVVSAGAVNLKVYGTSFNLNSFPADEFVRVTLLEGSISMSSPLGKFNNNEELFIEPGQTLTFFVNSKKLMVKNDDAILYTAWKDGIIMFKNNTFETVLKQLSRKFNVDIELRDKTLASIPMDATFKDENINEILRLLSLSTPFRFYYEVSRKLPDKTFAKSKIFIDKK